MYLCLSFIGGHTVGPRGGKFGMGGRGFLPQKVRKVPPYPPKKVPFKTPRRMTIGVTSEVAGGQNRGRDFFAVKYTAGGGRCGGECHAERKGLGGVGFGTYNSKPGQGRVALSRKLFLN